MLGLTKFFSCETFQLLYGLAQEQSIVINEMHAYTTY